MARARVDYRSITGGLFMGAMGTLFALSCLLFMVGSVVPSVADALGKGDLGVGTLLGSLLGAAFFGPIGFFSFRGVWRELRKLFGTAARDESPAVPAARPALRDGPGLAVRWLAAVPLMLIAALGPVLVSVVYRAWRDLDLYGRPFGAAFGENLPGAWPLALVPLVVTAGFLLSRKRMASWPTAAALTALAVLALGSVASSSAIADPALLKTSLLVAVIAAAYWLGRLAEQALTRPVAADVVRSGLEIAFRLPRRLPRLRVQQDGLTLDRLRRWGTGMATSKINLSFAEITDVRVETPTSPTRWVVTSPYENVTSREISVPAGPAVRVEAGSTTWLLPARSERVARTIVTAIASRGHR